MNIDSSWQTFLAPELEKAYFIKIQSFLEEAQKEGKVIYPAEEHRFKAFNLCPLDQVKVVLLGQDPYHNPNQAMGLSFSVPKALKVPPSLRNIYKELKNDIEGFEAPLHGDLTKWAEEGVLLLNAILTVEHKKAGSHRKVGWQHFTDALIKKLSEEQEGLVFMLWGNFAKAKAELIDQEKHLILEAIHPSPLAGNGFQGSKHFSQANAYLSANGKTTIDWNLLDF